MVKAQKNNQIEREKGRVGIVSNNLIITEIEKSLGRVGIPREMANEMMTRVMEAKL